MYRIVQDFLNDWKYEKLATMKVLKALSDASLEQKTTPQGRSLGFLAWHITISLGEMGQKAGLQVSAPSEDSSVPVKASDISAAYKKAGDSLASEVEEKWSDAMLFEQIDMYGEKWTRAATLASLVKHQIHHRAQMTVLMRQTGLQVPGVYGPSREEWSKIGMTAPR